MGRSYLGVDATAFKSGRERKTIEAIDTYLRDLSRGASANQPATAPSGGGTSLGASYLTVANETALSAERKISIASPLTGSDGGANNSYSIGLSTAALAALLGAVPTFSYGTTFTAGAAATFIRTDAQHKFPSALMSTANSATLTLTDNATDQTLTGSLGGITLNTGGGDSISAVGGTITLSPGPNASGGIVLKSDTTTPASPCVSVQMRPSLGGITGMNVSWFSGAIASSASTTYRIWDATLTHSSKIGDSASGFNATIIPYGNSIFSLTPSAGSGTANIAYGAKFTGPFIANATGGWADVATIYCVAPKRSLATPVLTQGNTLTLETCTIGSTTQTGIYLKQNTAQVTATDRFGILIDAQNSGTNRTSIKGGDRAYFESPAARAITVLDLRQLAVGGVAGAHINFDDKAGDPPAPVTGDLWRNGDSLWFRQAALNVDLTAAAAAATPRSYWMPTFLHMGA